MSQEKYTTQIYNLGDAINKSVNKDKVIIIRSTLPQHFSGQQKYIDGYYVEKMPKIKCINGPINLEHWSNPIMKEMCEKYGFRYLNSAPLYGNRSDLHFVAGECTHYCYHSQIVIPEMALLNQLLQ